MENTNTITPPENASASSDFRPTFTSKLFECLLSCAFAFRTCLPFFFPDPAKSNGRVETVEQSCRPPEDDGAEIVNPTVVGKCSNFPVAGEYAARHENDGAPSFSSDPEENAPSSSTLPEMVCLPFFLPDNAYAPSSSSNPQENPPSVEINAGARASSSIPHGNAPSYFSTPSEYATAPCSSYTSSNFSPACPVPTSYPDYDVFINHRGPDVKTGFATVLYDRLASLGWQVFLDKHEMQGGLEINSQIKHAIETAFLHIAIFSPTYAESDWCLSELHQMSEMCKSDRAILIPVFYRVEPSQVRWATGPYGEALLRHENKQRCNSQTIQDWKAALFCAATISGFELEAFNGEDKMLLDEVVGRVLEIGKRGSSRYITSTEEFQRTVLLHQRRSKAMVVGIVGPGGVGKTELAKDFYQNKKSEYKASCFLSDVDVKESSRISLQTKVIEELTQLDVQIDTIDEGKDELKRLISSLFASTSFHALIVLDGVDDADQIDGVMSIMDILGSNSLILVTSRDKQVLEKARIPVTSIYNLTGLCKPPQKTMIRLGSDQFKRLPSWLDQRRRLKILWLHDSLNLKCLSGSYGVLNRLTELNIVDCGIQTMTEDLVKMNQLEVFRVYNCPLDELFFRVVGNTVSLSVRKTLPGPSSKPSLEAACPNLKRLWINSCTNLEKVGSLPKTLITVDLSYCSRLNEIKGLSYLPRLEQLDISGCNKVKELPSLTALRSLKSLKASRCYKLKSINGLADLSALTILDLSYCNRLSEIKGLRDLDRLKQLDISGCEELEELPSLESLESLERLKVSRCYKIKSIKGLTGLSALTIVDLSYCNRLSEIEGLRDLPKLNELDISACEEVEELPSLQKLISLEKLKASKCYKLKSINGLSDLRKLQRLHVRDCREIQVLQCVECCSCLKVLDARDCPKLKWGHGVLDRLRPHLEVCLVYSFDNGHQ